MRAIQKLATSRRTVQDPPPLLDLDFAQGPLPAAAHFERPSGHESFFDGQGAAGVVMTPDTPAYDHLYDAATGAWVPAGIPIRPSRRNQLANPTAVFAPGATVPTGWELVSGLNAAASVTLAPAAEKGLAGVDITLSGRTSGNTGSRYYVSILFDKIPLRDDSEPEEADTSTPGAGRGVGLGQPLSLLLHPRLVGGGLAAIVACEAFVRVYDSADVQLGITAVPFVPTEEPAASQPAPATRTMPTTATWAYARPGLRLTIMGASDLGLVLRVLGIDAQVGTSVSGLIPAGAEALRDGGSLSVDLPPGRYDVLIEDTEATWQDAVTITTDALLLEPRAGSEHIRRVRVWPAGALSEPTKRQFVSGTMRQPTYVIAADSGLVLDEASRVVEWQIAPGVRAYQPDPAFRPRYIVDEDGPGVVGDGIAWLFLDMPRAYGDDLTIAAVFSSASDSLRQTLLGMGNTSSGYQLEINGQRPRVAAALIYGSYVSVSEVVPSWQDGAVLLYSRRGADRHTWGVNGRQNIGATTAGTAAYSGNGQKYLFCRAPGEQPFIGILREIQLFLDGAITQDQERLLDRALRGTRKIVADAKGIWNTTAGGMSPTSFRVSTDITQAAQRVSLLVTDDPTCRSRIVEVDPKPTVPLRRDNVRQYHLYKTEVSGLSPAKRYYYNFRIDGQVDASAWQSVKTLPPKGARAPLVALLGSCWSVPASLRMPIADAMASEMADLVIQLGDNGYPNHATLDLGIIRERSHRKVLASPNVQALLAQTGMAWTPDNHDWAGSNPDWAEVVKGIATKDVFKASGAVYRESFPHFPLVQEELGETDPDKLIVSQQIDSGRILWLLPDTISQRRYRDVPAAQATIMGHATGHETWDQLSWFVDRLRNASTDEFDLIVFVCPNRWSANNFPAWSLTYNAEYLVVIEAMKACPVPIMIVVGDIHMCAFDDGSNLGTSAPRSDNTLCIPQVVPSPLHNGSLGNSPTSGTYKWQGLESKVRATRSYTRLAFDYRGLDLVWRATCITQDSTTGVASVAQTVSSEDGILGVRLDATEMLVREGDEIRIPIQKTWFGKPCAVRWVASSGQSGTASFRTNEGRVFAALPAGGDSEITLTLSDPQGCVLHIPSVAKIGVIAAQTGIAIDGMAVKPSREWTLAYDELVRALKGSAQWTGAIYIGAAHDQQAATLNWTNPGAGLLTTVNSPIWVPKRGWRGNGAGYLNSALGWSAIPGLSQNDAHAGCYVVDDDGTGAGPTMSIASAENSLYLDPRNASGQINARINNATTQTVAAPQATANGSTIVSRNSATAWQRFRDGAQLADGASTSAAPGAGALRLLRSATAYGSGRTVAVATAGGHRDAAQAAAFHAAISTFLNRIAGITT